MSLLVYTVAVDQPGCRTYWHLAKLLVSSLSRAEPSVPCRVYHNGESSMFALPRSNVTEFDLGTLEATDYQNPWLQKALIGRELLEECEWSTLLFLDADCLVTRSLSDMLSGEWDICCPRETGHSIAEIQFSGLLSDIEKQSASQFGFNSGVVAVNRRSAPEFFDRWIKANVQSRSVRACCGDQPALNRVMLDSSFRHKDIADYVSLPYHLGRRNTAPITHWVGLSGQDKIPASFGAYMSSFFLDSAMTLFNILEH
jgi:hypothetical protein